MVPTHELFGKHESGRGFGFTGAHNHVSCRDENFRKVMLNAIRWTEKVEIHEEGCPSPPVSESRIKENVDEKKANSKNEVPGTDK